MYLYFPDTLHPWTTPAFKLEAAITYNRLTPNGHFSGRTAPLTHRCCIFFIIQQIYVMNILNMLHNLCFFPLHNNAAFLGSCIIHILYTGCAKI
jgi:hypothetical protein